MWGIVALLGSFCLVRSACGAGGDLVWEDHVDTAGGADVLNALAVRSGLVFAAGFDTNTAGNRTPLAHAAARTKGTYPAALYQRLAARRGRKRPILAVAHAFVVIAFHMLSHHEPYCELGPSYLDKQRRDHFVDRLTRRMQRLGYRVHLEPVQTA